MPGIKYSLEKGGPKRLEISWTGKWQAITVRMDGQDIGTFRDVDHLQAGEDFMLADGTCLRIQLAGSPTFPLFRILKDGNPVASAGPGPEQRLKMVVQFLYMIGGINLLLGLMGGVPSFHSRGLPLGGWFSVVAGVLFLVLGYLVMRKSAAALWIASGILVLDAIGALFFYGGSGGFVWIGIVFRVLILFVLLQGFGAIAAIKRDQEAKD